VQKSGTKESLFTLFFVEKKKAWVASSSGTVLRLRKEETWLLKI